jgi:DNA-binding transcriptional MerR regulator
MTSDGFSIGRMAELNCVSEKALRFYHQKGLLVPDHIDQSSGYRYYSWLQCSTIDMIQQLQSLGFTLDEIQAIRDSQDIAVLAKALEGRKSDIDKEMGQLEIARHGVSQLLANCRLLQAGPACNQVTLEFVQERKILVFEIFNDRAREIIEDAEAFLKEWELNLRMTKRHMRDAGIPLTLFHTIGCIVDQEDLRQRRYRLKAAFIPIDDLLSRVEPRIAPIQTIPPGNYLTLFKNSYTEADGGNSEKRGLDDLLDFADKKGYALAGDYYGQIVAETPAFLYQGREMFCKLQIPVAKNGRLPG